MGIDRALIVSAGIAVALAVGAVSWNLYSHRPPRTYRPGDRVAELPEVDFRSTARTVVIFVNIRCEACRRSLPLFRAMRDRAKSTHLVIAGMDGLEFLNAYAADNGLSGCQIVSLGRRMIPVALVPTVIVVDASSVVRRVQVGEVKTDAEKGSLLAEVG
jgi:hypothetical protein